MASGTASGTTSGTAPAAAGRPSKSERTRAAVLAAAEDLFSKRGFDATSLGAIGDRAGIQAGAVLYHYASKRELYEAVLERMFSPLVDAVVSQLRGAGTLPERLESITVTLVRFAADRPAAARLVLRESVAGSEAGSEVGEIVGTASQRHWQQFLDALAGEDDVAFDPLLVWNLIVGAICFFVGAGPVVGGLPQHADDAHRSDAFEASMIRVTRALCGFDHSAGLQAVRHGSPSPVGPPA
jgi:AcrR family transcriptional regulator